MRALPLLLALSACAAPTPAATSSSQKHWLLVMSETPDGFRVAEQVLVDAPLPVRRRPPVQAVRVSVRDGAGRVLYTETRPDPRLVRAELPGAGGGPAFVPAPGGASFLLRIPVLRDARSITLEPSSPDIDFPARTVPLDGSLEVTP